MSNYERERHELHQGLVEQLGPEKAATLMSFLPPVTTGDLATKYDLAILREQMVTKSDLAEVRNDLSREFSAEINTLRTETFTMFGKMRDDIRVWNLATMMTVLIVIFGQRLLT